MLRQSNPVVDVACKIMNILHVADYLLALLVLALPVAALSITISKGLIFENVRKQCMEASPWLGELLRCPYCMSHWVAFFTVLVTGAFHIGFSSFWLINLMISTFGVVALATPISWIVYRSYKTLEPGPSPDVEKLRAVLEQAKQRLQEQAKEIETLKAQ